MLDQMFTAENFRRIYDAENRKGLDLASRYFPTLEPLTLAVRDKVQDIREHRALESKLPDTASQEFEYLGYRFTCIGDKFGVSPSAGKVEKYRARMKASDLPPVGSLDLM